MAYAQGDVLPIAEDNSKPRANFLQENEVPYPIPLTAFRWADGTIPDTTGAAGNPQIVMGGYGSGTGIFIGEDSQAAAKTETLFFDFALPECYVAAQTVILAVTCRYNDAGTNTMATKTLTCEAYKIAEAGTAGSNLEGGSTVHYIDGTMSQYLTTLDSPTLSPGDLLRVYIQIITEGNSGGVVKAELGGASIWLDIKG